MKIGREPRNPGRTRERLLQAAFQEVYRCGFNHTDLDAILATAGVTKGALYHHFANKEALGYAIVDEVIGGITREKWVLPLQQAEDPIQALIHIIQSTSHKREDIGCGCPLNNLAQEMSPLDEEFRKRLAKLFDDWHHAIANALQSGQKRGIVRSDVDPSETATFIIAAYEGHLSIAKTSLNPRVLQSGKRTIVHYLESLRPTPIRASGFVD